MTSPLLTARSLSHVTETGQPLVQDVSFELRTGDRLAIIGPNGAGKTTLLRMLSGALKPSAGEILVGDRPLHRLSPVERALQIAVVGQADQPDPRLTVRDYVGLGRLPHAGRQRASRERDIVLGALHRTALLPFVARSMGSLSGGERQRAQLARAMAQQPAILFLDEPTNHLDPLARSDLLTLVTELDITVVAVLHDLTLVTPFATLVAVLKETRLHSVGTPHQALTTQTVRDVFGIDLLRLRHPREDRELTIFDVPVQQSTKA